MRIIGIILIVILILCAGLYFGALKFVNTKGKDILAGYIEQNFNEKALIASLHFKFPFNVEIKDFSCGDISFSKANISGGFYQPFVSQLVLNNVVIDGCKVKIKHDGAKISINPFYVKAGTDKSSLVIEGNRGFIISSAFAQEQEKVPSSVNKKFSLKINNIYLNDAQAEFVDSTKREPVRLQFKGISLKLKNFIYPEFYKIFINMNAFVYNQQGEGGDSVKVDGWLDYYNKSMDIKIKADKLNCFVFTDFYPSFWQPQRFGVEEAFLSSNIKLTSKDNDLVIESLLVLENIKFKEVLEEENAELYKREQYLKTVLALLKGMKDKPSINLKLKTNMDSPKLDFASVKNSFKGMLTIDAGVIMGEIVGKVEEVKQEAEKALEDKSIDETVNAIKDVVGTFKDMFGK